MLLHFMRYALAMGRVAGIPLYWHWSFLPLLGWALYQVYWLPAAIDWWQMAWVCTIIVLLFVYVLVHELGHALVARHYGQITERIIFFPLGGGAYIPKMPTRVRQEIAVYFAGPLSNLALAFLLFPLLLLSADGLLYLRYYLNPFSNIVLPQNWWTQLLSISIAVNLLLGFLNLIPAYPLDGGRILQAMLRQSLGARRATLIVSGLGLCTSAGLVIYGFLRADWLMAIGGLFIGVLSLQAIRQGWQQRRLAQHQVASLQRSLPAERIYLQTNLLEAQQYLVTSGHPILPVFDQWNNCKGFLAEEDLEELPAPLDSFAVKDYYDPFWSATFKDQNLLPATEAIIKSNAYGAVIYKQDKAVGLLAMDDIMALLA